MVGFGKEASVSSIVQSLDKFYSKGGAATGGGILTRTMLMKQGELEKVSAFTSQLDNQLRIAMEKGSELPPDDNALDRPFKVIVLGGSETFNLRQGEAQKR